MARRPVNPGGLQKTSMHFSYRTAKAGFGTYLRDVNLLPFSRNSDASASRLSRDVSRPIFVQTTKARNQFRFRTQQCKAPLRLQPCVQIFEQSWKREDNFSLLLGNITSLYRGTRQNNFAPFLRVAVVRSGFIP